MASKEVEKAEAPPRPSVVEVAAGVIPRDGDVISRYLKTESDREEMTPELTHLHIIQEILASATVDDVLEVLDPEKWTPFIGRHLKILGWTHVDSEYDTGPPVYFVVKLIDVEEGTKHIVTTGEQAIMAQLMRLEMLKAFPVDVVPKQATKPTRHGKYLVRLAKWEESNG